MSKFMEVVRELADGAPCVLGEEGYHCGYCGYETLYRHYMDQWHYHDDCCAWRQLKDELENLRRTAQTVTVGVAEAP